MVNYSKWTREDLEKERDKLCAWLRSNKPDPKNVFDRDVYSGNIFNFRSVSSLLREFEIKQILKGQDMETQLAMLEREGIDIKNESKIEMLISAFLTGYGEGALHAMMAIK